MTIRKKVEEGARKTAVPSITASPPTSAKPSTPLDVVPEGGERVDQIREILFGAQRQEYERRLSQIEELLVKNITELSKETAARFASLQQETDKKFARLEELLVKSISDISRDIERKMDSHTADNDKRFKQMEQHVDEAISELKKETVHQFNLQKNEYSQKFGSLEERLPKIVAEFNKKMDAEVASLARSVDTARAESTRSTEQLDRQKMDRVTLAKFLHNIAAGIESKEHKADPGGK